MKQGSNSGLPFARWVPLFKSVHPPKTQFKSIHLSKTQFPHLKNGNSHNCSQSLCQNYMTQIICLQIFLFFFIGTIEIILTLQNYFEMVYMKAPGTKYSSTTVLAFDSLDTTNSLSTPHLIKSASIVLTLNKVSDYFQIQESSNTCQL